MTWLIDANLGRRSGDVDLEAEFTPSLLNSAVYLLQLIQQISTFAVNYQGRPFRESLSENKGMYYGIVGVTALAFACSMELVPEINEQMKLVPFSEEFKTHMTGVMVLDYAACYIIERALKALFSDFRPRDIAERRAEQLVREKERTEGEVVQKEREKKEEAERKEREEDERREQQVREFERRLAARQQAQGR